MLDFIGNGLFLRSIGKRRRGFNPVSLFAGGTVRGVWFDPSDRTTLYQDAAGTIPANQPGHPVGLALDKSKGLVLGPEDAPNGGGFTSASGWTLDGAAATISGGRLRITGAVAGSSVGQRAYFVKGRVAGTVHQRSITVESCDNTVVFEVGGVQQVVTAPGTYSIRGIVTAASTNSVYMPNGGNCVISAVSSKELPGYHATQTVAASRPTLARHPKGGRRNLLVQTENFADAAWVKTGIAVAGNTITTETVGQDFISQPVSLLSGVVHKFSCKIKAGTTNFAAIRASGFDLSPPVFFNVAAGLVTLAGSGASNASISGPDSEGYFLCSFDYTTVTTLAGFYRVYPADVANNLNTPVGMTILAKEAQVSVASAPAYQKVTTAYDVTEAGVEDLWYLAFDGVDDFLVTPAIDLTGTDKLGVFAGVRKLSDGAAAILAELSPNLNNNTGSFYLAAPVTPGTGTYNFTTRGTVIAAANTSEYPAPISSVLTGLDDIGGRMLSLRVNGVEKSKGSGDQGIGNYGNYPLYIGRRGVPSLPFNGNLYGLIVAGKMPTAAEIANTEAFLNGKTGAYAA